MGQLLIVWPGLPYGPYHSPRLGDKVMATIDVTNVAANGELGFDDVTVQTAASPKHTKSSPFSVSLSSSSSLFI